MNFTKGFNVPNHTNMSLQSDLAGILQGVSSLLLVFDQGEVRKMVKECQAIIDYLKMAEIVQSAEDITQFTKALTDGQWICMMGLWVKIGYPYCIVSECLK